MQRERAYNEILQTITKKLQKLDKLKEKPNDEAMIEDAMKSHHLYQKDTHRICGFWIQELHSICFRTKLFFVIYESVIEGSMYKAKYEPHQVIGMGTVQIKMFNEAKKSFLGVCVSDLKRYLIECFESNDFMYLAKIELLMFEKLIILLSKTKKRRNLYVLQRKMMIADQEGLARTSYILNMVSRFKGVFPGGEVDHDYSKAIYIGDLGSSDNPTR